MKQERKIELDVLRGLAIIAVVLIHSIDVVLRSSNSPFPGRNFYVAVDQLSRFCVPMFVAVSGFVLAKNYQEKLPIFSFFKKRIWRLIPPYLFYSFLAYSFLRLPTVFYQNEQFSVWQIIFLGKADFPYYFVPMIVQLYLLFPLLILLLKKKNVTLLVGALAFQAVTIAFFTFQNEIRKVWGPDFSDLNQYLFSGSWIFYFALGAFMAQLRNKIPLRLNKLFLTAAILGAVWSVFDSFNMLDRGWGILTATRFTRFSVMAYCSCLIVWILSNPEAIKRMPRIINASLSAIGRNSYQIYLIHMLVLRILLMNFSSLITENLLLLSTGVIFLSQSLTWALSIIVLFPGYCKKLRKV